MNESTTRVFLREEIKANIDKILTSYFLNSHSNTKTPFAVVDLKEIDDEVGTKYTLEIEMIDENDDTTNIETKCDEIKELLNKKKEIVKNYAYVIFFENSTTKINEEKFIKTRLLNFTIKLYEFE